MTTEIINRFFEYASTYDKLLAVVGSFLILLGLVGGIDGKIRILLSIKRQIFIVLVGLTLALTPVIPLIFRDISLQELKAVKIKIDESRMELSRLNDKNGGDHGHFLDLDLIEGQRRIDNLIAKKEGK
jgi:hypothetical protein